MVNTIKNSSNSYSSQSAAAKNSDPLLYDLWLTLRKEYFPERSDIDGYQIVWSTRDQKRTLASCSLNRNKVRVAKELNAPALQHLLPPLLYHEMCHAYLGRSVSRYHGREFKELEERHPQTPYLKEWIKKGGWRSAVRSDRSRQVQARLRLKREGVYSDQVFLLKQHNTKRKQKRKSNFIQLVFDFIRQ